ncbi:MAG TPA: hypothetical protein VFP46_02255, partial [Candidatus Paceibacterota bacterium]|nr:hypothetical protein [Candidatus Paceibacterota bacterium]
YALLKLFEEPPQGTYLFLVLTSAGGLLPTLRSRVQELSVANARTSKFSDEAESFVKGDREKRSTLIKKLTSGKDEDERRELREEAITLVNGIEAAAYGALKEKPRKAVAALLEDIATLRGQLYERGAPVKQILEHLSLVIPRGLL